MIFMLEIWDDRIVFGGGLPGLKETGMLVKKFEKLILVYVVLDMEILLGL